MSFRIVKSIRINDVIEYIDIDVTASDVGAATGALVASGTILASNQLRADNYVMGNGGGSAGQVVRYSLNDSALQLATPDTPSNSQFVVGMLLSDTVSGISATILEMGRDSSVYTNLSAGPLYLGTASLPVTSPPLTTAGSVRQSLGWSTHSTTIHLRIGEMKIN